MIGKNAAGKLKLAKREHEARKKRRIVYVGGFVAEALRNLRENRAAHAVAAFAEVNVDEHGSFLGGLELRREREPRIRNGRRCRNDERRRAK